MNKIADITSIRKFSGLSFDVEGEEREKLQAVFPQCFNEDKLNIDKLLSLCGEYIDNDSEKYKFEWSGKSACLRLAQQRSTGTLRPCPEESVNFDTTKNLYIEGDNLEVLKLLQTAYFRRVKMIYIDPPYNTGNDFVYNDSFADPISHYKDVTSQATKSNPETMGRFHTNWLNMMYPRLRLAANLLRDDGVIFISIDDNEVHNMRKLCDEVFGEEHFVAELIWNLSSGTQAGHFTRSHEYVLAYAKSKVSLDYFKDLTGGTIKHGALKKISAMNPASDVTFRKGSIQCESNDAEFPDELGNSEKQYIVSGKLRFVNGILAEDVTIKAGWAMKNQLLSWLDGKETFDSKGQKVIRFYFNSQGILFYEKERGTVHPKTVLPNEIGNTKTGSEEIKGLFGDKVMDFPKPTALIEFLVKHIAQDDDDIVFDFFSGSATTAHAVMQLNREDYGNRRFMMVQLPELCDEKSEAFKAGYKNICEIGKERIRRAGAKLLETNEQPELGEEQHLPDVGFRCLKLDTSNLVEWDSTPIRDGNLETLWNRFNTLIKTIKPERSDMDIIYEVMLKLGVPLDFPVFPVEVNDKQAYSIGEDTMLLVCLQGDITPEDVEAMCDFAPAKIIAAEEAFADDTALSNAHYILKDREILMDLL